MTSVDPQSKECAEHRGHSNRPPNKTGHTQAEPNISGPTALSPQFANRLCGYLLLEERFFRGWVLEVKEPLYRYAF